MEFVQVCRIVNCVNVSDCDANLTAVLLNQDNAQVTY